MNPKSQISSEKDRNELIRIVKTITTLMHNANECVGTIFLRKKCIDIELLQVNNTPQNTLSIKFNPKSGLVMSVSNLSGEYKQDSTLYKNIIRLIDETCKFSTNDTEVAPITCHNFAYYKLIALVNNINKTIEAEKFKEVNSSISKKDKTEEVNAAPKLIGLLASICLILTVLTLYYFEIISFPIALVGVFVSFVPVFVSCCLNSSHINEQNNKKAFIEAD